METIGPRHIPTHGNLSLVGLPFRGKSDITDAGPVVVVARRAVGLRAAGNTLVGFAIGIRQTLVPVSLVLEGHLDLAPHIDRFGNDYPELGIPVVGSSGCRQHLDTLALGVIVCQTHLSSEGLAREDVSAGTSIRQFVGLYGIVTEIGTLTIHVGIGIGSPFHVLRHHAGRCQHGSNKRK